MARILCRDGPQLRLDHHDIRLKAELPPEPALVQRRPVRRAANGNRRLLQRPDYARVDGAGRIPELKRAVEVKANDYLL